MIQDIFPKQLNNSYQNREPKAESRIMAFRENRIYIRRAETLEFLFYKELADWCVKRETPLPAMVWLFSIGEADYFLTELPEAFLKEQKNGENESAGTSYEFVRMFEVRSKKPKEQVLAVATAWHLFVWYRDNQYCGRCGKRLMHSKALRMLSCPHCDNQVFPKIAPAVIVGVTDGEWILMTKYANREYKRYALIAGFTEIGETAEETVRREVKEEVGLAVKNIRYYKSQPWGFDSNLLLGYFCELDDTGEITLDREELATAEWVHYSDIPEDAEGLSLTREMMTVFRESYRKKKDCVDNRE